jgi:hypothetical protein
MVSTIAQVKEEIEAVEGAAGDGAAAALRAKRKTLFELTAHQFLIDSILAVHQLVGPSNRSAYQALVEGYMAMMDATLHQIAFDTRLDLVLRDMRFVLPFHDPANVRVEGGAQLAGFKPDDPLAPLGNLVFTLGLSAECIYVSAEGGEPLPLPLLGTYENEAGAQEAKVSVALDPARIGDGYSKNALMVAFVGELEIATPLADDLDTTAALEIGVRLPERSRLGSARHQGPARRGVGARERPVPAAAAPEAFSGRRSPAAPACSGRSSSASPSRGRTARSA